MGKYKTLKQLISDECPLPARPSHKIRATFGYIQKTIWRSLTLGVSSATEMRAVAAKYGVKMIKPLAGFGVLVKPCVCPKGVSPVQYPCFVYVCHP